MAEKPKKGQGEKAEEQFVKVPKKAYEGGEVVYWLQGEVSKDDSPLIRNAKRVFNEQTIPHVENDSTTVANIKYAMLQGAAAPKQRRIDDGVHPAVETEGAGRFVPPVATPTSEGNEGERANTPERAPSGRPATEATSETGTPGSEVSPPQ